MSCLIRALHKKFKRCCFNDILTEKKNLNEKLDSGRARANVRLGVVTSLEPVSFTRKVVACHQEKTVRRIKTTNSSLDKLSLDEATLHPVSCRGPWCRVRYFSWQQPCPQLETKSHLYDSGNRAKDQSNTPSKVK